jgi:hypothetical protein
MGGLFSRVLDALSGKSEKRILMLGTPPHIEPKNIAPTCVKFTCQGPDRKGEGVPHVRSTKPGPPCVPPPPVDGLGVYSTVDACVGCGRVAVVCRTRRGGQDDHPVSPAAGRGRAIHPHHRYDTHHTLY